MPTTLSGKLEELGLDDILQIVGVSRRTGVLTLRSRGREAVLQCRNGLLVRASSTGFQQSLGELMVQKGVVESGTVAQALTIQQQEGFRDRIGAILHQRFQVDLQVVEQVVREQITNVVMTLFAWHEGNFDFTPKEEIETVDGAYLDPLQLMLEQGDDLAGLEAQGELLQQRFGVHEPLPEQPVAAPAVEPPAASRCALVVVDDDTATAQAIAASFAETQVEVFALTQSEEALIKVDALCRAGRMPVVLIDLIMPKMDGSGVLGGLELLKLLRGNFPDLAVVMMTDFHHQEAEQECAELGCACLLKPRRGNLAPDEMAGFTTHLQSALQACRQKNAA